MTPSTSKRQPSLRRHQRAFTLIELLLAVAVLALIAGVAVPVYRGYVLEAQVGQAVQEVRQMELILKDAVLDGRLPATLAEAGITGMTDPWGYAYQYLPIAGYPGNTNNARKDKDEKPINSDFDLYSPGADGETNKSLQSKKTDDDVFRGKNGGFVGLGRDY
jgi:general secretion pathway protein G